MSLHYLYQVVNCSLQKLIVIVEAIRCIIAPTNIIISLLDKGAFQLAYLLIVFNNYPLYCSYGG